MGEAAVRRSKPGLRPQDLDRRPAGGPTPPPAGSHLDVGTATGDDDNETQEAHTRRRYPYVPVPPTLVERTEDVGGRCAPGHEVDGNNFSTHAADFVRGAGETPALPALTPESLR